MRIGLIIISLFINSISIASISIKGNISGMDGNKTIYIYEYLVNETILFDSTIVKKGKFSFKYKALDLGKYKLGFDKKTSKDIILGNENILITADYNDFKNSFSIEESKENDVYKLFASTEKEFLEQSDKVNLKARQIRANDPQRMEKIQVIQAQFDVFSKKRVEMLTQIAKENTTSYSGINSSYIISLNTAASEDFYKEASTPALQRGDVFTKSFNTYLSRFLAGKSQPELKSKLADLPQTLAEGSRERETIYLALISWTKKLDPKFSASIARKYVKEYKSSLYATNIAKKLPKLPPTIGDIAPNFTLKNPEGIEVPLSSTKGIHKLK